MLDVLCLCVSHNLVPMAALTKEQPRPNDKAEFAKGWKNGYYTRRQLPPSLSRHHRKPEIKNNHKKHFKDENRCPNHKERFGSKEDTKQKNQDVPQFEQEQVPLMKYDRKINTSYTPFTLIVHVLIILQHLYTLYVTPSTSISSMRLASFTQLVYVTTTCFHIATLLANIFKKAQLERAFVLYGTWVIWIGWAMCLWLIRSENRPDPVFYRSLSSPTDGVYNNSDGHFYINHDGSIDMFDLEYLLAPMNVAPFLLHGKWSSTTLPVISFFLLLVIRRNHWGLIIWEYLVLLDYSRTLKWYRAWCVAGASAGWMLTWEAAKFWLKIPLSYSEGHVRYKTDLPTFPGLFNVLFVSFMAGMFMICWWNFWTFQYRGVIWKKEFKEGVVVWLSDGSMRVGGIGC